MEIGYTEGQNQVRRGNKNETVHKIDRLEITWRRPELSKCNEQYR
jgi:hypothetical protein